MAQTLCQSDGTAPSAPSVSFNQVMNAISSCAADSVRALLDQEPQLAHTFGMKFESKTKNKHRILLDKCTRTLTCTN